MSNLQSYIKELSKTLAPAYGPETCAEAVDRLLQYYRTLCQGRKEGFVVALVGELVVQKAKEKAAQEATERVLTETEG